MNIFNIFFKIKITHLKWKQSLIYLNKLSKYKIVFKKPINYMNKNKMILL